MILNILDISGFMSREVLPRKNLRCTFRNFPFSKVTPEESDRSILLLGFNGVLHLSAPLISPLFSLSGTYGQPLSATF